MQNVDRRPRRGVGGRDRARRSGWPRPWTTAPTRTRRRCGGSRCRWRSSGSASARRRWSRRRWSAWAATATSRSPGMPLLFRESPLNSIWEGSGNVNALDVLRALGREPEVLDAWITEVGRASGADPRLDAAIRRRSRPSPTPPAPRGGARRLAAQMALCLQGALLVQHAPAEVADAFCASRLGSEYAGTLGDPAARPRPRGDRRPRHARSSGELRAPRARTFCRRGLVRRGARLRDLHRLHLPRRRPDRGDLERGDVHRVPVRAQPAQRLAARGHRVRRVPLLPDQPLRRRARRVQADRQRLRRLHPAAADRARRRVARRHPAAGPG